MPRTALLASTALVALIASGVWPSALAAGLAFDSPLKLRNVSKILWNQNSNDAQYPVDS